MKTILTGLPMYGYWPGSVFMYVRGIEMCVCARMVCVCMWCVCVWGVCACGYCIIIEDGFYLPGTEGGESLGKECPLLASGGETFFGGKRS